MSYRRALLCTAAVFAFASHAAAADESSFTLNIFDESATATVVPMGGPVEGSYGNINPFWGNINPFWRNISPFWGNIDPFWRNINPFWRNINPFEGDVASMNGAVDPFWGNISPFYGNINPFWRSIQPFWNDVSPMWRNISPFWRGLSPYSEAETGTYAALQSDLYDFVARSEATWGERVQTATGSSFRAGFADAVFAKYGMNIDDPATLSGITDEQRARFFLDWYDGLMAYSGMDRVDHWMGTVRWTPALTQDQGTGADAMIGLLDAAISGDGDLQNNIEFAGGYSGYSNDHGAAVASLIFAAHDGKGVMGIAPGARVSLYNPFDDTGTASWEDVRAGITTLSARGADVVNLSLGVPGWALHQGLADILSDPALQTSLANTVFVAAAGNEGRAQKENVVWNGVTAPDNLIIVGSVDLDQKISTFSNTPDEACIVVGGTCAEANKLKYRFLVAPGELLLVSDNHGGVTRASGTSFATPLVSGALTLLYDRWPWLQQHAAESVQIILESAKDIGSSGVDPVYGWGLLDVEASQSPLNFDNLAVYQGSEQVALGDLKAMALSATTRGTWELGGASLRAFETVGDTFRDFEIPLSTLLYGQASSSGRTERFQRHIHGRLIDWANGASAFAPSGRIEHEDIAFDGWSVSLSGGDTNPYSDAINPDLPFDMGYSLESQTTGARFAFGYGTGSTAAFGQPGFALQTDYDPATGGVNPILGLAAGDTYFSAGYQLSDELSIALGYTEFQDDGASNPLTGSSMQSLTGTAPYEATALVLDVRYAASRTFSMSATYTQLEEATGLLGVQGMGLLSLAGGATTDALTLGAAVKLAGDLELSLSGTAARTRPGGLAGSALSISDGGIVATAFAVALQHDSVFVARDALRFSIAQPLHVESGALTFTSIGVVDRDTGELGTVAEPWKLSTGEREVAAEVLYATPVLEGAGELALTASANLTGDNGVSIGSRLSLRF